MVSKTFYCSYGPEEIAEYVAGFAAGEFTLLTDYSRDAYRLREALREAGVKFTTKNWSGGPTLFTQG